MIGESVKDSLLWYVIHTNPRQEERAASNLRAWMVETLSPKIKGGHYNTYTGQIDYKIKPLFPGYIFARFNLAKSFQKVRFTRGIHSVVSFGGRPTPVDEKIVDLIRSRMTEDQFVRMADEFKAGDEVRVKEGPLKNFIGIFERGMKEDGRVMILLKTISYQAHIVIQQELVEKVS